MESRHLIEGNTGLISDGTHIADSGDNGFNAAPKVR